MKLGCGGTNPFLKICASQIGKTLPRAKTPKKYVSCHRFVSEWTQSLTWRDKVYRFAFRNPEFHWRNQRVSNPIRCMSLPKPTVTLEFGNDVTIRQKGFSDQSSKACLWKKCHHGIQVIMRFMRLRIHKVFRLPLFTTCNPENTSDSSVLVLRRWWKNTADGFCLYTDIHAKIEVHSTWLSC